jgi:hypothetical protein
MTAKEKAKELFDYHYYCLVQSNITKRGYWAQHCALITVDQIMKQFIEIHNKFKESEIIDGDVKETANYIYWREVKKELESYEDSH